MPAITPQHQILPDPHYRVLGVAEFSVINSSQSLRPEVVDISFYEPTGDFAYTKEVLCSVDLDQAASAGGDAAISFTYKDTINNNTHAEIAGITADSAITCYNESSIFGGNPSFILYSGIPEDATFHYVYTVASEECRLEYICSLSNIDEDIPEEDKERYYELIENAHRSKAIKMSVDIGYSDRIPLGWQSSVKFYIVTNIDTWPAPYVDNSFDTNLDSAIEMYNKINLHDDSTMRP